MKNLSYLIQQSQILDTTLLHSNVVGPWDRVLIEGITDDSRKVQPGFIFVAVKGFRSDGHDYIQKAIDQGASAVVYENGTKLPPGDFAGMKSENSRRALALLYSAWYDQPSRKLKVIGITGTDGKTTTANLLYHILKGSGKKAGLISTLNARIGAKEIDTGFHVTNPPPELLQKLLSQMAAESLEYAVLEVTSHGLDQERSAGVEFFGAAITNVTHEHLDYHKTYQSYLETKGRLFTKVDFSVLNRDDSSFEYLRSIAVGKIITYGLTEPADFVAENIILKGAQSHWELVEASGRGRAGINLNLPGVYNIANALAGAASARQLGLTLTEIKLGLESFEGLTGRFELIEEGQTFKAIVDFAHTPNALEKVLEFTHSKFLIPNSKLIVVFGCAGERDKGKRPMMGEIAGRLADVSIFTAEDPRKEDVDEIIEQMVVGALKAGAMERSDIRDQKSEIQFKDKKIFARVHDRREAIELAVSLAQAEDVVLITGKGHEKSMCFGTTEYPWSDQEVAREALRKLGSGKIIFGRSREDRA